MSKFSTRKIAFAALVAAVYAALTMINPWGYGPVQFRISELLCILPFFFPYSVWGLFVGCILSNLISAYGLYDVVFGSLASLLAGFCTMQLGKIRPQSLLTKALACLPPVIFNALIIGGVIVLSASTPGETYWFTALTVGLGEAVVLYVLGLPAMVLLPKSAFFRTLQSLYAKEIEQ
ncbi:MAG TPA: QueT transporter family protein [Papillibacter sp.]|jgi:uncharacterized membrane protein|nr:QueT transporter family protein [Papillibacter sp.]